MFHQNVLHASRLLGFIAAMILLLLLHFGNLVSGYNSISVMTSRIYLNILKGVSYNNKKKTFCNNYFPTMML